MSDFKKMKRYKVEVCFTAWVNETVEAETAAKAIEKACSTFTTEGCSDAKADYANSFVATEEEIEVIEDE